MRTKLSRSIILASLLVCSSAFADERTYQGGAWNLASSWSPAGVPTQSDRANFFADHVGNVFLAGGFDLDEIYVSGDASGYTFTGEGGSFGHVRRVQTDAQNTLFDLTQLTGQAVGKGYAIGLQGDGSTEWRTSLVDTNSQPLDAYIAGVFTRPNFHTGNTVLHNYTALRDSGSFNNTPLLSVDRASLEINNKVGDPSPNNRIGDSTRLQLNHAFVFFNNDSILTTEDIGGIDLGLGHNRISSSGSDLYAPGAALLRDASQHGTLMLETAYGSTHVAPAMGIGSHVVPWATRYGNLAYYDAGENDLPGDGDDGGFIDVPYNSISTATTTQHAEVSSSYTMNTSFTVLSATVRDSQTLNLNNSVLTLTDAALVLDNNANVTQGITGRIDFAGTHGEAFVHVPSGNAAVSARLSSGVGLVKGGDGNLLLSGANNISGPIYFNNGMLEIGSVNAVSASNELHLVESSVKFNYGVGGTVANHIIFNAGRSDIMFGGSYLYDFSVKDNTNWNFSGTIEGAGPYFVNGENSKVTISGVHASTPGVYGAQDGFSLWPQGTVNVEITGRLGDINNRGTMILFGGRLTGNGEVSGGIQVTNGGLFAPGLNGGAGVALFKTHDLSMFDGRVEMQINGTARGTQYDAIDVTDFAVFGGGGTLAISGTVIASVGQVFDLIRFPSGFAFNGGPTFTNTVAVSSGGQWVHWIDNDSLTFAVAGPTGDSTLDGHVNFDDLLILAQHYGEQGSANWTTGDLTYDGNVNFDDLLLIAQHYGQNALTAGQIDALGSTFASDFAMALTLAPEPSSLVLLTSLLAVKGRGRR